MWIVGFLTSLVYVFVFFFSKIYADMGLQIYYAGISVYGFWQWTQKKKKPMSSPDEKALSEAIIYRHVSPLSLTGFCVAILVLFLLLYYLLHTFTDSPIPAGDAFTTAIGIIATYMLARRIIEHWIFWIVVNLVSVYLYYLRGLYPTMFLYACYTILAAVGLYTWKKKGTKENDSSI